MPPCRPPVDRLVVGVDGSPASRAALRLAGDLAARLAVPLYAVMTWEYPATAVLPGGAGALPAAPAIDARMVESLDDVVAAELDADRAAAVRRSVVRGRPSTALRAAVADHPDALLVVGARVLGGLDDLLLGSTSRALVHPGDHAVAVVKEHSGPVALDTFVVGVDGTPPAARALRWAGALAAPLGASLTAVHALDLQPGSHAAATGLRDLAHDHLGGEWSRTLDDLDVPLRTVLADDDPRAVLESEARRRGAGLLVVGHPRPHRGAHWPRGSVADFLVRRATGPVVVVP